MSIPARRPCRERGSALVVSLLLLVVLSVLGTTFLTMARTETSIATNQGKAAQALYVAESGAHVAYRQLVTAGAFSRTHEADGSPAASPIVPTAFPGGTLVLDDAAANGLRDERNDGRIVWEWSPGDPGRGLTGTGLPESFRIEIRPATAAPGENDFVIDVAGNVGEFRRRIQVLGTNEPLFHYMLFADGDLGDFTRGVKQQVFGAVHANGDIYFAPEGTELKIHSPSVVATGRMIRSRDAWGRGVSAAARVDIQGASGMTEMVGGAAGQAMDSEHADWANADPGDGIDGALDLWGGVVRDGSLGAEHVEVPPVEHFLPGGRYQLSAGLRLETGDVQRDGLGNDVSATVNDAVREVTFWNAAIAEYVTVQEVDVQKLSAAGLYPANGLLYSDGPVRLVNARRLPADLTVASAHSIYTKGDYNSQNKRAAALMSVGRVWHVSDAWQDDDASTKGPVAGRQAASGVTSVNAAILDGQPVVDEANWADLDRDGAPDRPTAGDASPNGDHLLEAWGSSRVLKSRGALIHLRFADMADDPDNSALRPEELAWIKHDAFEAPHRDSRFDQSLAGMAGQPPFWPSSLKIYRWQEVLP